MKETRPRLFFQNLPGESFEYDVLMSEVRKITSIDFNFRFAYVVRFKTRPVLDFTMKVYPREYDGDENQVELATIHRGGENEIRRLLAEYDKLHK